MRNTASIDILTERLSYECYCRSKNDNKAEIERMKQFMYKAMELELTERQRQCITEYYINGKNMKQISAELGISPSAVSRHIKRGVANIKKKLEYF